MQHFEKSLDYTFSLYSGPLQFFVRSIGNFTIPPFYHEPVRHATWAEIFWCIDGELTIYHNRKNFILKPQTVWFYPPGCDHNFGANGNGCHYRWLTVDGPGAGFLVKGLNLKPGLNPVSQCPEDLFRNIELNIVNPKLEKRLEVLADAFKILSLAASGTIKQHTPTRFDEIRQFIDSNFHSSDLNINKLAELFHLHRVVLSRKFKKIFDVSISDYLISLRLRHAINLLNDSDLSVTEIAYRCGFTSPIYFNKAIRKATGSTPGHLRNQHR